MPPRPKKHFHKAAKGQPPPVPETADEFLAAGVEYEEAGEKWRAGDAAKAARFFTRALDTYTTGWTRYPQSFDLAFNKARLEYAISQQSPILKQLASTEDVWLRNARQSHSVALALRPDDPDARFNLAQVWTSIGDEATLEVPLTDKGRLEAAEAYQEALGCFRECTSVQVQLLAEQEQQRAEAQAHLASDAKAEAESEVAAQAAKTEQTEEWVSVQEAVTPATVVETCIAHLETMASFAYVADPSNSILVEDLQLVMQATLDMAHQYGREPDQLKSLLFAQAAVTVAMGYFSYNAGQASAADYAGSLGMYDKALEEKSGATLSRYLDAVLQFNATLHKRAQKTPDDANIRWQVLSHALTILEAANKNPPRQFARADINLNRGDLELLRMQLGRPGVGFATASTNALQLLQNATTYYEGAEKLLANNPDESIVDYEDLLPRRDIVVFLRQRLDAEAPASSSDDAAVMSDMMQDDLLQQIEELEFEDSLDPNLATCLRALIASM